VRRRALWAAVGAFTVTAAGLTATTGPVAGAGAVTSFGTGGRQTRDLVDGLAAVLGADGNLVAVGVGPYSDKKVIYTEYHPATGEPVVSAELVVPGADGTEHSSARVFEPHGIAATADGGTVVQFNTSVGSAIAKITGSGAADPSFSGDGWLTDSFVQCGLTADLVVGPDGALYSIVNDLAGNTAPGKANCPGTGLRKYSATGVKVQDWGGAANNEHGGLHDARLEAAAGAIAADGSLLAAGVVFGTGGGTEVAGVLKVDPAGTKVGAFGTGGLRSFDPTPASPPEYYGNIPAFPRTFDSKGAIDVAVDGQGRILLLGSGRPQPGQDIDVWVARLLPGGALDSSFGGGDGIAFADVSGDGYDYGLSLAVDGLDRPVVTGATNPTALGGGAVDSRAAFSLRLTTAGAVDTTVTPTVTTFGTGRPHAPKSAVLTAGGAVLSAGSYDRGFYNWDYRGYVGATEFDAVPVPPVVFTGLTPQRMLDSRDGSGAVTAGSPRSVTVAGVPGGAPADATAVSVNVTVVDPTAGGYLSAYPTGGAPPTASVLNFAPGQTVANALVVGVGTGGRIDLSLGAGSADVVVDVMGWFDAANGFTGVTPVRAIDTRDHGGALTLGPGQTRTVTVTGLGAVPAASSVKAVAVNLTAVGAGAGGHLRAWPGTGSAPHASVLNFTAGATVANAMVLGVDGSGRITVANHSDGPVDLVVDVMGWFSTSAPFTGVAPVRALDTRDTASPLGVDERRLVTVTGLGGIPADGSVKGVVVNVTVTEPTAAGFFAAFPAGGTPPTASLLNFTPGATVANAVVLGVDGSGRIELRNSVGRTHAVVDVLGWF
jgi:hypothetical protein